MYRVFRVFRDNEGKIFHKVPVGGAKTERGARALATRQWGECIIVKIWYVISSAPKRGAQFLYRIWYLITSYTICNWVCYFFVFKYKIQSVNLLFWYLNTNFVFKYKIQKYKIRSWFCTKYIQKVENICAKFILIFLLFCGNI